MAFFGTPATTQQIPNRSPQQQGVNSDLLTQLSGLLGGLGNRQPITSGNQFNFEPIANQARMNFNQNTLPSLAEKFTALGGSDTKRSAYSPTLARAGAGLDANLAALKAQYDYNSHNQQQQFGLQERGQENDLLSNLLNIGMQPGFDTVRNAPQSGFLEKSGSHIGGTLLDILPQLLPILLSIGGGAAGGPAGGAAGAAGGQALSSWLSQYLGGHSSNQNQPSIGQFENRFGGNYIGGNQ